MNPGRAIAGYQFVDMRNLLVCAIAFEMLNAFTSTTKHSALEQYQTVLSLTAESEPGTSLPFDAAVLHELSFSCAQTAISCAEYVAALRRAGHAQEAREVAKEALERGPALWPLWTSLGLLFASDGESIAAR